jgi:hypothetical protein
MTVNELIKLINNKFKISFNNLYLYYITKT